MRQDSTSLDRLHDIVLPPDVPWWPLAPGWYVVIAVVTLVAAGLARRSWKRWQANAYRRAALRELRTLRDAPAIAELLRRAALASVPRSIVAERTGQAWADWVAAHCSEAMPPEVHRQLASGAYRRPGKASDLDALRAYAARWITQHSSADSAPARAR